MTDQNNTPATESYIDWSAPGMNYDEAREPQLMENNSEQELEIRSAEYYISQNGGRSLKVVFKHAHNPMDYSLITEYLGIPSPDDDDERRNNKLRKSKQFHAAINMRPQGVNLTDPTNNLYVGRTLRAVVRIEEDQTGEFGPKNRIKVYIKAA